MQHDYRHLQPIKISFIGAESGRERYFSEKDRTVIPPRIAAWRNNLTALSARRNFFFVAQRELVAVFEPNVHSSRLGSQPRLNLRPVLARPDAPGYLDRFRPHCINQLIVGDLGSEEILLLCTDSGNVTAYFTSAIGQEIAKGRSGETSDIQVEPCDTIAPFFSQWVEESAWGLAIHTNARMLAVSANVPRDQPDGSPATITVFAFALANGDAPSAEGGRVSETRRGTHVRTLSTTALDPEWNSWSPDLATLPDRSRNWKVRLARHRQNIPSISFINFEPDRDGHHLMSTDIAGISKVWRVWRQEEVRSWKSPDNPTAFDRFASFGGLPGWAILPLDPRCFRVVDTFPEYCGLSPRPSGLDDEEERSQYRLQIPSYGEVVSRNLLVDQADGAMVGGSGRNEALPLTPRRRPGSEASQDGETGTVPSTDAGDLTPNSTDLEAEAILNATERSEDEQQPPSRSIAVYADAREGQDGRKVKFLNPLSLRHNWTPRSMQHEAIIPTLQLSATGLRLFDSRNPHETILTCPELLAMVMPAYYHAHPALDRLNLTQYIPELELVVVASQVGYAAVCSLTRLRGTGAFGLRVDWVLPFQEQENSLQRPPTFLLGIAAGPVPNDQPSQSGSDSSFLSDESDSDDDDNNSDAGLCWRGCPDVEHARAEPGANGRSVTASKRGAPSSSNSYDSGESVKRCDGMARPRASHAFVATLSDAIVVGKEGSTKSSSEALRPLSYRTAYKGSLFNIPGHSCDAPSPPLHRSAGYSRRYRLMMAYADHTVLTYELTRQCPFVGDPMLGRRNWRNQHEC